MSNVTLDNIQSNSNINNTKHNNQNNISNFLSKSNQINQSNENHTEEYYIKKLEEQQKAFDILGKKKDKEIEEFFSQIEQENQELKKEIIQCKIELEEEKAKTQNMKETYFNINSFDESNPELDRIVYENIKYIKEENEKKLNEITELYKIQLENANKDAQSIRKAIKFTIDNYDSRNSSTADFYDNIFTSNQILENKIKSLIEDNFNKEKYSLMLNQKYELATEENNFLKNKIMQEKTNICEQINELQKQNLSSHFEMIQNLLAELNDKKQNFFSIKFTDSFNELTSFINETIENNKTLVEHNENMKKICEGLKSKLEIVMEEKNTLLNESKKIIVAGEIKSSNEINYQANLTKLEDEISILKNKNENLLKQNASLAEQIELINSKLDLQIKSVNNANNVLLNQKSSMIAQLSTQLNVANSQIFELKKEIKDNENAISSLTIENQNLIEKEKNLQNEIMNYKVELNKHNLSTKITNDSSKAMELINSNIDKKISLLQKEKSEMENKYSILNNKFISLNSEISELKKENSSLQRKNTDLDNQYTEMKVKFGQNQKMFELYQQEIDLLHTVQTHLRQIYQCHFRNSPDTNDEISILKEINERLTQRFTKNQISSIPFNEQFSSLEQNKNSQLYENLIIFILNLQAQNNIEVYNAMIDSSNNQGINNLSGANTNHSVNNSNGINSNNSIKKSLEELKNELDDKYYSYEKRIRSSISIEDFEKIIFEVKGLYEQMIDHIIQAFYNCKVDSNNKTLTIQMQIEKYHQILNNLNVNMSKIESSLKLKVNEYKGQSYKIENALNYLMKYININI